MQRSLARTLAALVLLAGLAACVITDPSPYAHGVLQPGFNKAWNNAIDAMKDEGVQVVTSDLASGHLEGRRGGIRMTADVVKGSIGDVRIEFAATGATHEDPRLVDRVRQRYDARMASK